MTLIKKRLFCTLILLSVVYLASLQDLGNVPKQLRALAAKLSHDRDIQESIYGLADDGQSVAKSFSQMLKDHGHRIFKEKNDLMKKSNAESVNIDALKVTLTDAKVSLLLERNKIEMLQTDIHNSIENCNSRKRDLGIEKRFINVRLDSIPKEIQNLDNDINLKEESIRDSEHSADYYWTRASDLRKEAENRRGGPEILFGIVGAVAGIFLAPYTGFTTLAMVGGGTAAGAIVGSLLNDAQEFEEKAAHARREAIWELSRVRDLKSKKADIQTKRSSLEGDTLTLQAKSDDIELAFSGLQDVTVYLRSSVNTIDKVLDAIQDMDTALKDAHLQSDSFSIIKTAFSGHEERIETKANVYLTELKKKWKRLEEVLLQYGTRSRLT